VTERRRDETLFVNIVHSRSSVWRFLHHQTEEEKSSMFQAWCLTASLFLIATGVFAQQRGLQDPLLDQFAGTWVLRGTIAGKETTHDIDARWILGHEYLQFREVSRENDSTGAPAYEAQVTISWDEPSERYACLWLDNTGGGGLTGSAIGYAIGESGRIAFLFKGNDGSLFHTTFVRDRDTDSWRWLMDGDEQGTLRPFARVTLRRQ
jgi:hypothetical protein